MNNIKSIRKYATRKTAILCAAAMMTVFMANTGIPEAVRADDKKVIHVVTKIEKDGYDETDTLKYNSNGLLVLRKTKDETDEYSDSYTYDSKGKITKHIRKVNKKKTLAETYSYDSKDRLETVSGTDYSQKKSAPYYNYKYTYEYNKKNQVDQIVMTPKVFPKEWNEGTKLTYTGHEFYTYNSKGYILEYTRIKGQETDSSKIFTYDKRGNVKQTKESDGGKITKSNTYKSSLLTVQKIKSSSSYAPKATITISYERIEVDKKYISEIRKQQHAILNDLTRTYYYGSSRERNIIGLFGEKLW